LSAGCCLSLICHRDVIFLRPCVIACKTRYIESVR
jgi:hypothetical protein